MARKHKHEEHENHERWLVSYADFITLLFAFFVVMYAISELDKRKLEKVSHAVRFALATHETGGDSKNPFDVFEAGMDKQFGELERLKLETQAEQKEEDSSSSSTNDKPEEAPSEPRAPGRSELGGGADPGIRDAKARIEKLLSAEGLQGKGLGIKLQITSEGLRIRLPGEFLFEPGTAKLKPDAPPLLRDLGAELRMLDNEIRVEGHSQRNPFIDTWGVSVTRATRIARFLIEDGGVLPSKVYSAGYGSQRPAPDAPTGQRYEILVLK